LKAFEETRMCVFAQGRVCLVELDEIPLEVCRLCLDAWKISRGNITVKAPVKRVEAETPRAVQAEAQTPEAGEPSIPAHIRRSLSELDRLFIEDGIGLEEYVQKRRQILSSASRPSTPLSSIEERLESLGNVEAQNALFIVEAGKVKAKYPEGATLPDGLDGKALKAIHELFENMHEHISDVRLSFRSWSILGLDRRGRRLALLLIGGKAEREDLSEVVREAQTLLREHENWEEILPLLYGIAFGGVKPASIES
jgi:hypothetical protein